MGIRLKRQQPTPAEHLIGGLFPAARQVAEPVPGDIVITGSDKDGYRPWWVTDGKRVRCPHMVAHKTRQEALLCGEFSLGYLEIPDARADPMTGCLPVTAESQRLPL